MKAPSLSTNTSTRCGYSAQSLLSVRSSTGSGNAKASRRRSRAVSKPPITVLSADTANFQAMVQQLTGIPPPPHLPHSPSANHLQLTHDSVMNSFSNGISHMNTSSQLSARSYSPLLDPVSLPTLDTSSFLLEKHGRQQLSVASSSPLSSDSLSPSSIPTFDLYSSPCASSSSPTCNPNPGVASAITGAGGAAAMALETAFTSELKTSYHDYGTNCMEEMNRQLDNLLTQETNELDDLRMLQDLDSWLLAPLSENDAAHAIAHYQAPIQVNGS